ncbi:hypothetical protein HBI56_203890 [Parastagonospora nodorum]|uniref:Uncharacterized protein n=1 Tax=Phaeosphaeria nodorum (strain SN15 / ATCC MYA-4574 / FGSC 10173) TaxID=321614 RepID=A0A7U2I4J6_PHANO|nr:hypothetical protein HBH56_142150 [Parastagonospora nodorum]QRD01595.1 hypothetical protein JI435_417040 [Parastagonospora nodorum SN15]KAH3927608.1 hypothetical protein HBH54_147340 [Parastagonospora nodorum]KAH3947828.1 hypothetical protein HBH53_107420 [Parastagonospora nodorum]KAH3962064.1 hypothetical protein HBH51_179590 [Parastagonospora nodorum]
MAHAGAVICQAHRGRTCNCARRYVGSLLPGEFDGSESICIARRSKIWGMERIERIESFNDTRDQPCLEIQKLPGFEYIMISAVLAL